MRVRGVVPTPTAYVGTSGWMYDWNPDGFDWYAKYSNLNAVELNASFYRFPFPNQVKSWASKTERLTNGRMRWAVKVTRLVTHVHLLNERALKPWRAFLRTMKPLDKYVDFYLLQLPPRARPTEPFITRLTSFLKEAVKDVGEWRVAVEFRDESWFSDEWVEFCASLGVTYVSVDSPQATYVRSSGPAAYVRMHGREFWYAHYYTDEELDEVASVLSELSIEKAYVFFNNDHDMLENARRFMLKLTKHGFKLG